MRANADAGGCFPTGRHYPGIAHLIQIRARGLADEFAADTAMADLTLVSIDTETTGRNPQSDRIVEIACIVWRGGEAVARHDWLINPGVPIPEEAREVHGISDDQVRDKPGFAAIVPELVTALANGLPLAYNAEFDRDFLLAEIERAGLSTNLGAMNGGSGVTPPALRRGVEWVDPLIWARELQKDEKSRALGEVAERLGINIEQAHRATDDAEAAVRVMQAFFADTRVPKSYGGFVQEQRRLARLFADERAQWRPRAVT